MHEWMSSDALPSGGGRAEGIVVRSADGLPCCLSAQEDGSGYVSRIADRPEDVLRGAESRGGRIKGQGR
jgi:hypothetical protein